MEVEFSKHAASNEHFLTLNVDLRAVSRQTAFLNAGHCHIVFCTVSIILGEV